jgi:glycosyltransferase involved in cell wall biosynthesis
MTLDRRLNVLLEMRPAFDGYAGIPQETRLLFRGLCACPSIDVEGLLQMSLRFISPGVRDIDERSYATDSLAEVSRHSSVVISIDSPPPRDSLGKIGVFLRARRTAYRLSLLSILFPKRNHVEITTFRSRNFADFIWRRLFDKTLPASDFHMVTRRNFRVCAIPWNVLQTAGLATRKCLPDAVYPRLALEGVDVFIAQTPYPGRTPSSTSLVVRYHDAFPILMPHTIANKSRHQSTHLNALMSNAKSGAHFACVSEATRQDLIRLLPELEERSVTIHNMISRDFYEDDSPADRVNQIVRLRTNPASALYPAFATNKAKEEFYERSLHQRPLKYLLMVATIEPRKNHAKLLSAWELIRAELDPTVKLIVVGNLGWDTGAIVQEMRHWIEQGELFALSGVPAPDLRTLYRHAAATVCPSVAEGFDYSGVESLACGGVMVSSDIPVHREIYDNASEYFDPYCSRSLVEAIHKVAYSADADARRSTLKENGRQVSARYTSENILPKWENFINSIVQKRLAVGSRSH